MQENKNLVQEAFIQMKNVEEAIAENAKGILQSTMKEEISQLVKESLYEQEEVDVDAEVDLEDSDDTEDDEMSMDMNMGMDNMDDMDDMDDMSDMDMGSGETPIDLTDASDEEILRVFKAMGEDDGIIIKKDGGDVHLKDNNEDVEYLIKLGESRKTKSKRNMRLNEASEEFDFEEESDSFDMGGDDMDTQAVIDKLFQTEDEDLDSDEVMYEIEFDESEDMDESDDMMDESEDMDESDDMMDESEDMDENWEESLDEAYNHKKGHKKETKEGKKMSVKPKGVGLGSGPKFKYNDKAVGGFKEDKKQGPKSVGTGKAKFEYKKGANMDGKSKVVKKAETKEAARTLGMGSNFRRGGLPKPRAHSKVNNAIKEGAEIEVRMLREKNEEYRKALNVFREKLNEVAIFNSNLAYATRLFTEHSTTKKEKINILRRFDDVESLKESKNLYKSIKEELNKVDSKPINESVDKQINKTVSSGSATNLIESKTYENPQFLRMKDLMSKIK